jgi:hypothetical protein
MTERQLTDHTVEAFALPKRVGKATFSEPFKKPHQAEDIFDVRYEAHDFWAGGYLYGTITERGRSTGRKHVHRFIYHPHGVPWGLGTVPVRIIDTTMPVSAQEVREFVLHMIRCYLIRIVPLREARVTSVLTVAKANYVSCFDKMPHFRHPSIYRHRLGFVFMRYACIINEDSLRPEDGNILERWLRYKAWIDAIGAHNFGNLFPDGVPGSFPEMKNMFLGSMHYGCDDYWGQ